MLDCLRRWPEGWIWTSFDAAFNNASDRSFICFIGLNLFRIEREALDF